MQETDGEMDLPSGDTERNEKEEKRLKEEAEKAEEEKKQAEMFKSLELDVLKREINELIDERVRNSPTDAEKQNTKRKKSPNNSKKGSQDSNREPFSDRKKI